MKNEKTTPRMAAYAPHAPYDRDKLASMIRVLRRSGRNALPPCWAQGDKMGYSDCYEGSHRLAAWEYMGMAPRIAGLSAADLEAAAVHGGYADANDMHGADLDEITAVLDAWDDAGRPD